MSGLSLGQPAASCVAFLAISALHIRDSLVGTLWDSLVVLLVFHYRTIHRS